MEHWDGSVWSSAPGAGAGLPLAITCPDATTCIAVGVGLASPEPTFAEVWNGTKWSVVPTPNIAGEGANELHAVSCPSVTSCFAVGSAFNGSAPRTLIEHWNGTTWSISPSPTPAGGGIPGLESLQCLSDSSCYAEGSYETVTGSDVVPLVEHWDGTTWSIVATGWAVGIGDFTCPTATSCFGLTSAAAGAGTRRTIIDHWDGATWSVGPALSIDPPSTVLLAIACATATRCFAVGSGSGRGTVVGVIEQSNGSTWSQVLQAFNPTPPNSVLDAVSCAVPAACFGVGHYTNIAGKVATLIERPSGTTWTIVTSPNHVGVPSNVLSGIACTSASSCFAVGSSGGTKGRTLIERWNGSAWSITPSANHTNSSHYTNVLTGVACASATSCVAVGSYNEGSFNGTFDTLVQRWDGKAWSLVPSPNRSKFGYNLLEGVACPSATSCFAVGQSSTDPIGTYRTLVEHWDGTTWSIAGSPDASGRVNDNLAGVACASAKLCVAVGSTSTRTSGKSLVEVYNGSGWRIAASADPAGATSTALAGVSCATTRTCVSVGRSSGADALNQTVVETMTGTTWSTATGAAPAGAEASSFNGVSCAPAGCVAVGDDEIGAAPHTLVERHG